METKVCKKCRAAFQITDRDLDFYSRVSPVFAGKKYQVPSPTLCPECRMQRRFSWREKDFFLRKCDKTGKMCFSRYPQDAPVVTYSNDIFHSDEWSGLDYGRDFDFSRPFFEQFAELLAECPRHISNTTTMENSDFLINAGFDKNCYMGDEMDNSRDCLFGYNIQECESVVGSVYTVKSRYCYDCVLVTNCYEVFYSNNVENSSHSAFLKDCKGVKNCLFCVNLRQKEYCIFNKQVSKEEFEKAWAYLFSGKRERVDQARKQFVEFAGQFPVRASTMQNTENSTGDFLINCKDCFNCFNMVGCENCSFCTDFHNSKDCYDTHIYQGEFLYESQQIGPANNVMGSRTIWYGTNVYYSVEIHTGKNLFGCASLKKKEYCVLNKQYTKEEYEKLAGRIIEHMQETGEWGQYLPSWMSPQNYDDTQASWHFPLSKEEAKQQGFVWRDRPAKPLPAGAEHVPNDLEQLDTDTITSKVFICSVTNKPFKIVPQELAFHLRYKIPLPNVAPVERIQGLVRTMPRKLIESTCQKCSVDIETTQNEGKIYCTSCFEKEVV